MNRSRMFSLVIAGIVVFGLGAAAGHWLSGTTLWRPAPVRSSESAALSGPAREVAAPAGAAPAGGLQLGRKVLYWYDPMQPQQHFDKPGKSPFMDMALQPKYADEASGPAGVRIDPQLLQNTGVRTAAVTRGRLDESIEVTGSLAYNDRDVTVVQARTGGIVERVYARAPNDWLEENAPLADVRVPDWYGAQAEYLALRRAGDSALVAAARDRLLQLGMSPALVSAVERSGVPQPLMTVRSGAPGVLQELGVREGMTVMPGQTLARINGLRTVWLEADVPEAQAAALAPGNSVSAVFAAWPGRSFAGKIAVVLPEVNPDVRTVRVRVELPNAGRELRPGMFARVRVEAAPAKEQWLVPTEAIIATGRRYVVIVAEGEGRFRPAEVRVGRDHDGKTEVLDGVKAGDQVVVSGQFLIDSEASLQGVLARMEAPAAPREPKTAPLHTARGKILEVEGTAIKIAHGAIPTLQWPAMTMTFRLKDAALARGVKAGDEVKFALRQSGDEYVIERLEKTEGRP